MRFNHSSKRDLYFEKAMKLYFEEGMCGTHICKVLPISRGILYKWIAIFVEQNPQVASMKRVTGINALMKRHTARLLPYSTRAWPHHI